MNALILSRNAEHTGFLNYALETEHCAHKTVNTLSALDTEIRFALPDILIIDLHFFSYTTARLIDLEKEESRWANRLFYRYFGFSVFIFNPQHCTFYEKPALGIIKQSESKIKHIQNIIASVEKKIPLFLHSIPDDFRPAENKLYALLKSDREKAFSLNEMACMLWGKTNAAHTKTLYAYLHRIKHSLKKCESSAEQLIKVKKGHYKLVFRSLEKA